jgi:hypothetical protein
MNSVLFSNRFRSMRVLWLVAGSILTKILCVLLSVHFDISQVLSPPPENLPGVPSPENSVRVQDLIRTRILRIRLTKVDP